MTTVLGMAANCIRGQKSTYRILCTLLLVAVLCLAAPLSAYALGESEPLAAQPQEQSQNVEDNAQNADSDNENVGGNGENADGNAENAGGNGENADDNTENIGDHTENGGSGNENADGNAENTGGNAENAGTRLLGALVGASPDNEKPAAGPIAPANVTEENTSDHVNGQPETTTLYSAPRSEDNPEEPIAPADITTVPATATDLTPAPDVVDTAAPAEMQPDVKGVTDAQKEIYNVPEGSAYISEIGSDASTTYYNDSLKGNAIQQAVTDALKYAAENKDLKSVTVVVADGVYEGGVTAVATSGGGSGITQSIASILGLADNWMNGLTLNIVARDILGESGKIEKNADGSLKADAAQLTSSAGNVQVEGQLVFDNINVLLAGIYLSTRDLVEKSTESEIQTVSVYGGDHFAYYGTEQDDTVSIGTYGVNENVAVHLGDGNDTLDIQVRRPSNFNFSVDIVGTVKDLYRLVALEAQQTRSAEQETEYQALCDTFKETFWSEAGKTAGGTLQNTLNVNVEGGDGDDTISAKVVNTSALNIGLSFQNTTGAAFAVDLTKTAMQVLGGSGNDAIAVSGGMDMTIGRSLFDFVFNKANGLYGVAQWNAFEKSTVSIDGGAGDDEISVDTTTGYVSFFGTDVKVTGGDGYDRLHLSGKLNAGDIITKVPEEDRIQFDTDGNLAVKALAELTFAENLVELLKAILADTIDLSNISASLPYRKDFLIVLQDTPEAFTDTLQNKRTVGVKNGMTAAQQLVPQDFTNYVLAADDDGNVSFSQADYQAAFSIDTTDGNLRFANLMIANPADSPTLLVKDAVDALTVGTVYAPALNVIIMAGEITLAENARIDGKNVLFLAYAEDPAVAAIEQPLVSDDFSEDTNVSLDIGVYDCSAAALVKLSKGTEVFASGFVGILAATLQTMPMLALGTDLLNALSVKIGRAKVELLGSITADGYIRVNSQVGVSITSAGCILPIALGIAVTESEITLQDATLRAGNGILLSAGTDVKAYNFAQAGLGIPAAIAGAVIVSDTHVSVLGASALTAGGDVHLIAESFTRSTTTATGKPVGSSLLSMNPSSGVFVAFSVIVQNTSAEIGGSSSVTAGGDILALSRAIAPSKTTSVAIPPNSGEGKIKVANVLNLFEKVLGLKSDSIKGVVTGTLFGSIKGSPQDALKNSLSSIEPEDPNKKETQVAGAVAIAVLINKNHALIDTTGGIQAGGALRVMATALTSSTVRADGSLYKNENGISGALPGFSFSLEKTPDNAVGAGVGVVYFTHENIARTKQASAVKAKGITVDATTLHAYSSDIVKSGYIPSSANVGVAGAVAVQIISVTNKATVGAAPVYTLTGGDLTVNAVGRGVFNTVGDASGKRSSPGLALLGFSIPFVSNSVNASGTGIGVGVAVAVIGVDCVADVEDGAKIILADAGTSLDSFTVNAEFGAQEREWAAAGAKSGTAIVPVVAVGVSGAYVKAAAGIAPDAAPLNVTGDALVRSVSEMERYLLADAALTAEGLGLAGSFGVTVLTDSSKAELKRSLRARNISVYASAISRLNGTVKACAQGATPSGKTYSQTPTGSTQASTTDLTTKVGGLASTSSSSSTPSEPGSSDKRANGLIASIMRIGGISKNNMNLQQTKVLDKMNNRQTASTSEGSVDVAAGIIVNIQENVSEATVGDGVALVAAADAAAVGGAVDVTALNDTDAIIKSNASAVISTTGVGVAAAVNVVDYSNIARIGAATVLAKTLTVHADIVEAAMQKTAEAVMGELIAYYAETGKLEALIAELYNHEKTLDDLIAEKTTAYYGSDEAYQALTKEEKEAAEVKAKQEIKAQVLKGLNAKIAGGDAVDVTASLFCEIIEGFFDTFFEKLQSPEFWLRIALNQTGDIDSMISDASMTAQVTAKKLRAAIIQYLTIRFGSNDEMDGVGHKISTTAISGAGAANVGVAGSAAVSVIDGTTQAILADRTSAVSNDIRIAGDMLLTADSAQKVYTTASASADLNGQAIKNKDGSGKPGKSVGVGASFAMNMIDLTVEATLGKLRTVSAGPCRFCPHRKTILMQSALQAPIRLRCVISTWAQRLHLRRLAHPGRISATAPPQRIFPWMRRLP